MTKTLRDELAAVLGPGNNDKIAYEQADSVIDVLWLHFDRLTDYTNDTIDACDVFLTHIGWNGKIHQEQRADNGTPRTWSNHD